MRISTLLETNTTPSSDPAANQSEQAPKFGRDPHVLEDEQLDETTAGSIATGEPANMGVQRRGKGSIFQGVKTSKKFANSASVKEGVAEDQLEEYGDTAKGQKMLAKVHHRAADRVTSKQADKDPAYARKAQQTQDRAWDRLAVKEQGVAEARPEPEQDQMDANRRAALRREREPHGSDKIDAMLAKRNAERREYEQTGNFWLKQKDTQEHLSDAFVGKAAANQAALELLKQRPELKGNLVITAWGPGEQPTNEALKPEALSALQTAKQTIQQKREQDIASWEQDFRRNFAKKRGMDVPQQQAQEPQSSQVAFPGEKHKDLQTRMTGLNAAVEKQKYLDYLTFKAEQRGLMNPGLEADIDTSMYIKDGAKDNYQALNQKLDKSIEKLKQRMGIHKIAYKKPKVMEDELSEEQIMAKDLFKRLELFNKAQDRELGNKPADKEIVAKEGQLDTEPLPQEFIEKAIYRVLLRQYPDVVRQYGAPIIGDAITTVANMHQDMDHIEAEEAALMLHQVINQLKTHLHMREEKQRLDPKCWKGYKKQGTKMKGDTRVNNCVKIEK